LGVLAVESSEILLQYKCATQQAIL